MGFKPLKLLAFLLGGLSAVMGAGALYLYATFDGARLAAELTQSLRQQTQRTVRLDGPVALSLFPRLSLRLPATTVSDPRSDGAFLAFERAELRVGLWPLLSRRVAIEAGISIARLPCPSTSCWSTRPARRASCCVAPMSAGEAAGSAWKRNWKSLVPASSMTSPGASG